MLSVFLNPSSLKFMPEKILKKEALEPEFYDHLQARLKTRLEDAERFRIQHLKQFRFRAILSACIILSTLAYVILHLTGDVTEAHSFRQTIALMGPSYQVWYLNSAEWIKWLMPAQLPLVLRMPSLLLLILVTFFLSWWSLNALMTYRTSMRQLLFMPSFRYKGNYFQTFQQRLPYTDFNNLFALPAYDEVVRRSSVADFREGAIITIAETKLLKRERAEDNIFPFLRYSPTFKGFFVWVNLASVDFGLKSVFDHLMIVPDHPSYRYLLNDIQPKSITLPEIEAGAQPERGLKIFGLNQELAEAIRQSKLSGFLNRLIEINSKADNYHLDDKLLHKMNSPWVDIAELSDYEPIAQLPHVVICNDQMYLTIPHARDVFPSISPLEPLVNMEDFDFIFAMIDAINELIDVIRRYQVA